VEFKNGLFSIYRYFGTNYSQRDLKERSVLVFSTLLQQLSHHVRWVPCHEGMARPQAVDGGHGRKYTYIE
jgi:hypothetical protein